MEATSRLTQSATKVAVTFGYSLLMPSASNTAYAQIEIAANPTWSPYLVGSLIGILVCVSLVLANKPIGASSAYSVLAGIFGKIFAPSHTKKLKYYQEHSTQFDWTLVFVIGIVLGAFVSAASGEELTGRFLPPLWVSQFGEQSHYLRFGVSFIGGVLLAFGARLAGGCTSGHGISGTLQLSVGSWVSLVSFFVGGAITARLMFG